MPIINKGTSFSNGEQLTALKINNLIDQATFNQSATDSVTTDVNSSGQITVNAGGISAAQLATNAVGTANILNANVTLSKIATQADQTVIANVSGGVASPTAVSIVGASGILINDDALGTSDTAGATQGNIKAYVDGGGGFTPTTSSTKSVTLPNGLIMKFGRVSVNGNGTNTTINFSNYGGNFTNACFSVVLTEERNGGETNGTRLASAPTTDSFETENHLNGSTPINFIAIGY